ncbi:hypothetical protein Vretifemale_16845 [Volvox reticuliferus]|uniref:Autophagy-related protein 2 n=2 Tax=Volvox reticuliferus TaxID=1737510 RepID=A0A8J4CWB5_9CHLO|nr:hypothetical protein Vretifemale_16845 [Volvox reticuliferus]
MLGTTDWLLKRFLKFVLKRNVGKYLSSEIDLEQLDVKLDTGKLELKNLLLNCDAVNKDLALGGWHVKAVYVGSVNAKLPSLFSSSSQCSVVVNEVVLTVAPALALLLPSAGSCPPGYPKQDGSSAPATAAPQGVPTPIQAIPPVTSPSSSGGAMSFLLADDFGWTGHGAVMDGIKRIAGSLQSLLQHMRIEASNVLIRVELPHPTEKDRVVTAALKLDLVEFGDLNSPSATSLSLVACSTLVQHQQNNPRGQSFDHKAEVGNSSRPSVGPLGAGDSVNTGPPVLAGAAAATTPASPGTSSRREIAKHIQVKGLSLDLFETTPLLTGASAAVASTGELSSPLASPNKAAASLPPPLPGSGFPPAGVTLVSGPGKHGLQLSMELRMVLPDDASKPTQIMADLHVGAVRLQLLPSHAVCLSALNGALGIQGAPQPTVDPGVSGSCAVGGGCMNASAELWASSYASASASMHSAAGQWGRRSLIESIMMPNCEGVVVHSLEPYVTSTGLSYGDDSEFHDACSRFGSLAGSLVSSMTQKGTNLLGYVTAGGSAAVGGAMDWMGGAAAQVQQLSPQPSLTRAGDVQLRLTTGSTAPPVAAMAAAAAFAAVATADETPFPPSAPQPIITVRAHVSHAAFVLCYGTSSSPTQTTQTHTKAPSTKGCNGANLGGDSGRALGTGAASIRWPVNGTMAAANKAAASATQSTGTLNPRTAGSLVAELQDLSCDVFLDVIHGNVVSIQAGQLQVYEQLPAAVGASNGMSPGEWGRVPEVLPQAPHRFRPTQPAPARSSGAVHSGASTSAVSGVCSPKLGFRQPGRNVQPTAASGSATGNGGNVLQTWPILMCASTHMPSTSGSATVPQFPHLQPHAPHGALGKAAANRPASQMAAVHAGAGTGYASPAGYACCFQLRASWGGGESTGAAGGGYDGYGNGAISAIPSYDLSVEVLPVTLWLSLPLVQRLTDFLAPLAAEPCKGHVVAKPKGPLPRLALTVVATHVCVLLALVPASPPALTLPRPPGSPVFLALDVVSHPHPSVEPSAHVSTAFQGAHCCPHNNHPQHPHQQLPYAAHHGAVPAQLYGSYGAVRHGANHQAYGAPPPPHSAYGNGWGGPANHQYGTYGYSAMQQGRWAGPGQHLAPPAWVVPEPPPLLAVYRAPATDRLIPSQVTTVDLATGVVELLIVRTAATGSPRERSQGGSAARGQPHVWSSGGGADAFGHGASWTSKSIFCLSAALPRSSVAETSSRPAWDAPLPHPVAQTGPSDVPPGCGLHLHVCCDPGIGMAPELVPEAWGHVTTHAQDRWADPDGEGGAWEERSSFRSVAFHERCRKSSATFVHLRAPKAQLHLSRADLQDLVTLPAIMQPPAPKERPCSTTKARHRQPPNASCREAAGGVPQAAFSAQQACVLLEIGLRIQLQDDCPAAEQDGLQGTAGVHATATGAAAPHSAAPHPPPPGPTAAPAVGLAPGVAASATGGGSNLSSSQGMGLVLGGSRVAMYELLVEELTVFRATNLGSQATCNVTSVHAHGMTLLGHLEQQHQQLQQQLQQAAEAHATTNAGGNAVNGVTRVADGRQRASPPASGCVASQPHSIAPGFQGSAVPRKSQSGSTAPQAICLMHCPSSAASADCKQPSCIEYVCVEGQQPPTHQPIGGGIVHESINGNRQIPGSAAVSIPPRANLQQQQVGDMNAATALHSVLLQGITVSTDHGYVTMDWAVQLGQLLEALAATTAPPAGGPGKGTAAATPPQTSQPREGGGSRVKGHLSVNVIDLALRHEPMDYPTIPTVPSGSNSTTAGGGGGGGGGNPAATALGGSGGRVSPVSLALIIEGIHVGLPLGGAELVPYMPPIHTVVLHSLTLHLAAADQRGPGWSACDPRAIREPLLQACGYHLVLQETSIKVVAKQRRYPRRSKAPVPPSDANVAAAAAAAAAAIIELAVDEAEEQFHTTLDVEITNQHLLGMLTVESATLLAHFAMQAGTLMTARQAAAVAAAAAAAGAPPRRGESGSRPANGGPADLYWDAASENSSSVVGGGAGGGTSSCTCGYSEAGGDAGGSLLTALLLEEVEENAFRRPPPQQPAVAAEREGAEAAGLGGGWYPAPTGDTSGQSLGGLILIDDFFPVNHNGEYDEDLMLVQHPPKGGAAAWRRDGAKMELEGTWYGPDEGPDTRRPGNGFSLQSSGFEQETSVDPTCIDSGSGVFTDVDVGLESAGLCSGGLDAGPEDPDIDDLLVLDSRTSGPTAELDAVALRRAQPSVASVGSSAATRLSNAPTWRLQEDYVRVPRKSDEDGTAGCGAGAGMAIGSAAIGGESGPEVCGAGAGGCAPLGGGVDQPPPVSRIMFKDLSGIWVMHTTRAAAGGDGSSGSGQQVGRVELVIEGLDLLLESYGPGGHLARHMKLTVHDLEIRDCALDVKQQQAAAAGGARPLALAAVAASAGGCSVGGVGGGGGWVRVLGYRTVRGRPRDSRAPLVALALTAVRPNPAACDPRDEEFRLAVALLPLRLKLNQDILSYLTWYGTSVSTALKPAAAVLASMQAALSELDGCEPLPPPFFQRAQIRGFSVMLDYRPRRVDIGALAEGRLLELLNLVPLGGVDLVCKSLRLAGVQGWDGLGAAVLREWLNDIARTQAHKFITGLAPINAVVKVGSAVATLVSAPARHLARREGTTAAGRQLAVQLRRTTATFAYRLLCEAMVASRKAASGARKALVRASNNALCIYGPGDQANGHNFDEEADGSHDGGGDDSEDSGNGDGDGSDGMEGGEDADECGDLDAASRYGGWSGTGGEGTGGGGGEGGLRRSQSASTVVRKGRLRAERNLGAVSQQVRAAVGLQHSVSSMARVLSAAALGGVSAAAPASAALQGQIKGTLRSVQRALRAQLLPGGSATAPGERRAPATPAGGYPTQPRPKED